METRQGDDRDHVTKPFHPRARRALWASLAALALCGGAYLWHHLSAQRTAQRAELARLEALQLTVRKMQALEREAELAEHARIFAERTAAEKRLREAQSSAQATAGKPVTENDPRI